MVKLVHWFAVPVISSTDVEICNLEEVIFAAVVTNHISMETSNKKVENRNLGAVLD